MLGKEWVSQCFWHVLGSVMSLNSTNPFPKKEQKQKTKPTKQKPKHGAESMPESFWKIVINLILKPPGTLAGLPWPSICFSWRLGRVPSAPLSTQPSPPPLGVKSGRKCGCLLWKLHSLPSCFSLFYNEFSNLGYFRIPRSWSEGNGSVWFVLRLPAHFLACTQSCGARWKEKMVCALMRCFPHRTICLSLLVWLDLCVSWLGSLSSANRRWR